MSLNTVEIIDDRVFLNHVLISVSDKTGLDTFVPGLLDLNPGVKIFSTGGTFSRLKEIMGDRALTNLMQVSDYTGQPETQGGLVKTLDFKIYLGILTETYNDDHQKDLQRTAGVPIDMVVVNLYPFKQTLSKPEATPENARGNIDIGGPCMVRASAKNFLRVTSVVDPADYNRILAELEKNDNHTSLALRYGLAQKSFAHTADYDRAIADYLGKTAFEHVSACYRSE